jgi:hypothetical protein
MPSLAQIKDMMSSRPVGGGRGVINPPMAKRAPLVMPEDMEDQPPLEQIREAKRRKGMQEAYDETTVRKATGGMTKGYSKGGSVTRADGCVKKGHTKGRMV